MTEIDICLPSNTPSRSRDTLCPSFSNSFRPLNPEGAGNAGCALHPRSHARSTRKRVRMSIQGSGEHPTFPAQWLYGLLRALPGEPCTIATVDANYGASGPHDFAVRSHAVRYSALPASTAPRPTFVAIMIRPSDRDGMQPI